MPIHWLEQPEGWLIKLAKAGMDYQELVGKIEAAFDPGADVRVGEWMESPDGSRDCDVSIRGTRDGAPFFAFAECKKRLRIPACL